MSIDRGACGGYYLGHAGSLHRFDDAHEALGRTWQDSTRYQTALSGYRRAYVTPRREPRSWRVAIPAARSGDVAALHTIKAALRPPFAFVDPWMQVTNVLTPEASTWTGQAGVTLAGSTLLADGSVAVVAATPASASTTVRLPACPVVPQRPVLGSVYAAGGPVTLALDWINAAGVYISSTTRTATLDSTPGRVTVGGNPPPAGAVTASLTVKGATLLAHPAITWTTAAQPWAIGGGVAAVVLGEISDDIEYAVPDRPDLIRTGVGFTLEEVHQ